MLTGCLGSEISVSGTVIRQLHFTCPQHGAKCPMMYHTIWVTTGPHKTVSLSPDTREVHVWTYLLEGGLIYVTPSISVQGACTFHDYYTFRRVAYKEDL